MNRSDLQRLARLRLDDVSVLLAGQRWSAAYYLTGYAVEFAMKSCVLRHLDETGILFKDRDYLKKLADCWTHDLSKLVNLAGLDATFGEDRQAKPKLEQFWSIVKEWKETSRYAETSEVDARDLLEAVANDPDGVFQWIQSHW